MCKYLIIKFLQIKTATFILNQFLVILCVLPFNYLFLAPERVKYDAFGFIKLKA